MIHHGLHNHNNYHAFNISSDNHVASSARVQYALLAIIVAVTANTVPGTAAAATVDDVCMACSGCSFAIARVSIRHGLSDGVMVGGRRLLAGQPQRVGGGSRKL